MPIYEYECGECGHRMEALQRMSDDPLKECPECHAQALRKLISAAAFKLKGQGWYESDFKQPPKKPDQSNKTGKEPQSGTASGNAGDTSNKGGDKSAASSNDGGSAAGGSQKAVSAPEKD